MVASSISPSLVSQTERCWMKKRDCVDSLPPVNLHHGRSRDMRHIEIMVSRNCGIRCDNPAAAHTRPHEFVHAICTRCFERAPSELSGRAASIQTTQRPRILILRSLFYRFKRKVFGKFCIEMRDL